GQSHAAICYTNMSVTSTSMEMTSDFGVLACGQEAAYGASHRCNVFIKVPFKTLDRPAQGNREGAGERRPRQQHGNHADAFAVQIARKEKALFANLVDRSHHILQRYSAAAHEFSVIVAIDQ